MVSSKYFILIYNRIARELESILHFESDITSATRKYGELEAADLESESKDILLVGSDSIDTVKVTHANYFTGEADRQVREALRFVGLA